jgi:hypothetical protein
VQVVIVEAADAGVVESVTNEVAKREPEIRIVSNLRIFNGSLSEHKNSCDIRASDGSLELDPNSAK